jgi:hypothetical protein
MVERRGDRVLKRNHRSFQKILAARLESVRFLSSFMLRDELSTLVETVLQLQMTKKTKLNVLQDYILWKWTGGLANKTKWLGCPFWSKKALDKWRPTRRQLKNGRKTKCDVSGLKHEHLVPRAVLAKVLFDRRNTGQLAIRATLDDLCRACVITKEEDDHFKADVLKAVMPQDWDGKDIWARYSHAFRDSGITVLEVTWPEAEILGVVFEVPGPCTARHNYRTS